MAGLRTGIKGFALGFTDTAFVFTLVAGFFCSCTFLGAGLGAWGFGFGFSAALTATAGNGAGTLLTGAALA